ncbi:hypothetical protein OVN18_05415 [Microcella daejeonensis]|uniref:Uncharacterized protein n=1 Tax=Microcella daejeonensis TaxID=2994971 RepID=A0A9E8MN36_9MICO|nr:hypothetical protein [Microcella daejeonensis]WAB82439.1 hypothetical protein OVN18_05415 [Microcella daejeonensis]
MTDPLTGIAIIAVCAAVFFYLLYLSVSAAMLDAMRKAAAEGILPRADAADAVARSAVDRSAPAPAPAPTD